MGVKKAGLPVPRPFCLVCRPFGPGFNSTRPSSEQAPNENALQYWKLYDAANGVFYHIHFESWQ